MAACPAQAELSLLELVAAEELDGLDECLSSGMLAEAGSAVAFRHELARLAVDSATTPRRRRVLHRAILAALAGSSDHAQTAAAQAAAAGAHREAAAQYARALWFAGGLDETGLAALLEHRAYECYLTGQNDEALAARLEARERYRAFGDRLREGDQLCWLSRLYWYAGQREDADAAAQAAVELLETLPPGAELARAYGAMAHRRSLALDPNGSAAWGDRAIALAAKLGEHEIVGQTLNTVGTAEGLAGRGVDRLQRSLELGLEHGFEDLVARAYGNLAVIACRGLDWDEAERVLADGLRYAGERDLDGDGAYLLACRAWVHVAQRTVDHHVSAILRKLGAGTRGEAASIGTRLGLLNMGGPTDAAAGPRP